MIAICFARTFGSPLKRSGTSCLLPLASRRPLGCRSTRVGDTTTRWTGWRRGTSSYGTTQRWTHPTRWRRGRQDSRKVGLGFTRQKGFLEKSWFLLAGDIPGAVLLFESACQKHPDSAEAWTLLGKTQAKNEQDPLAIAALRQALTLLGPSAKESSSVLMALAASYANESYQALACNTLQGTSVSKRLEAAADVSLFADWIYNHSECASQLPAKPALSPNRKSQLTTTFMSQELHQETTDLFLTVHAQWRFTSFYLLEITPSPIGCEDEP